MRQKAGYETGRVSMPPWRYPVSTGGLLVLGMCFWNFVFWCCVEIQKQISDGIDSRVLVGLWAEGGVFCNLWVHPATILLRERPFPAKWSKCKICAYASLFFSLLAMAKLPHHALLTPIFFHFHIKKQFPEVPMCSRDRVCYFGEVENKKMVLSRNGYL